MGAFQNVKVECFAEKLMVTFSHTPISKIIFKKRAVLKTSKNNPTEFPMSYRVVFFIAFNS